MRRTVLGITFILLSMGIGSCGLIGGDEPDIDTEQSSEPPSEQSFPSASPEIPTPPAAKVSLTRPTNPDERLRVVKSGRTDPFAEIVPSVSVEDKKALEQQFNQLKSSSSQFNQPRSNASQSNQNNTPVASPSNSSKTSASKTSASKTSASKTSASKTSASKTSASSKIVLPTLPKPEVAQGVEVTGVINLGGRPRAILKAPGEKATRTVGVGERIASGQVLVKAITLGASPVVVLEQSGMEVRIGVGQEPIALASASDKSKR